MVERRQHERIPFRAEVMVRLTGPPLRMTVRDLSIGGAFLETTLYDHMELKTGGRCELTLLVDETMPTHTVEDGHTVHALARIVRRDLGDPRSGRPAGVGVQFEGVDLDNQARLRELVGQAA
jgi:hypothetical protein